MVTARWGKYKFVVSKKKIASFTDLTMKGSLKTEEKTKTQDGQEITTKKNTKATEVQMTVHFYASTGCMVRWEALRLVRLAKMGKKAYLYIGGRKLSWYKLMLTDAQIKEVQFYTKKGKMHWYSADVALTFKQSSKSSKESESTDSSDSGSSSGSGSSGGSSGGGGGSSGGGGYNGGSQKVSVHDYDDNDVDAVSSAQPSNDVDAVSSAQPSSEQSTRSAQETINQTRSQAAQTTRETYSNSALSAVASKSRSLAETLRLRASGG